MDSEFFLEEIGDDGVARVTLTREQVHNAFNDALIADLTRCLQGLESEPRVRVVVLAARGKSFSAGADLNWMKRMAGYGEAENLEDARGAAALMETLNGLAKPTVALVQGSAFGGGVGLVSCCDVALAVESARFALTEVRLGLIPAVISPYVVAKIGHSAARRYFLTAEQMTAREALQLGLVHEVVPQEALEERGAEVITALLAGGPESLAACKDLIFAVSHRPADETVREDTARRIARMRASQEGRDGVAAFLEKRKPDWVKD